MSAKRPETSRKGRMWCGTLNNYSEEEEDKVKEFISEHCIYGIYGREVGENGTPHLQCYFHLPEQQRGSYLKNFIPRIHIELCRGNEEQNVNYCQKEGDFWEHGTLNKKVTQSLEKTRKLKTMLEDYMNMGYLEFAEKWPREAYKDKTKLEQWRIDHTPVTEPYDRDLKDKNYWIWGSPGTGKSRWARSQCPQEQIYLKATNKWWSGYIDNVHHLILMEDFPNDAKYMANLIKLWADRYSFTAEVKGGTLLIEPKKWYLIITSNYSIDECFEGADALAIKRRFREVMILSDRDIFFENKLDFNQ